MEMYADSAMNVGGGCLLSIIIPSYNYARMLPRVLVSVLSQVDSECEVIVVDDGSTDNTLEVLAGIHNTSQKPFLYVTQANAGAAAARNKGEQLSSGKWLLFLDADDELLPGAVNVVLAACRQHDQAGLFLAGHTVVFPNGSEKYHAPTPVDGSALQRAERYLLRKEISICHGACVYRREIFQARPYVEKLRQREDIPVFAYMLVMSKVVCINQSTVRIYKHDGSLRRLSSCTGGADELVDAVFERLPLECSVLRDSYRVQRDLSEFRRLYISREWRQARKLYSQIIAKSPLQALRWSYLKKFLRLIVRR